LTKSPVLLLLFLLFSLPVSGDDGALRESFLVRLNQERAAGGLPPLRLVEIGEGLAPILSS